MTKKKKQSGSVRRRPPKKQPRRLIRTIVATALLAFVAATTGLNFTQLRDHDLVAELLYAVGADTLDLSGLGLEGFFGTEQYSIPAAAAQSEYAQTTFTQCPQFFPKQGMPQVPASRSLRELCFSSFAVLHNGQTKTPVFVVERLNRKTLAGTAAISRTDRFYEEARLPQAERARLVDYRNSGYSRGHMAPAGNMHTDKAMAQSFSLANIVPQNQRHNAGAWNRIENDTQKYVQRASGDVYVFTGPVYAEQINFIGEGRVAVPTYLYKLVYDPAVGRSWVHWHENAEETRARSPISYDEFVKRTGLYLLGDLNQSEEGSINQDSQ